MKKIKKFSNSEINKAGLVLAGLDNIFSKDESYKILKYFRESHHQAMRSFRVLLQRKKMKKV